jgi:cytokinin dehydrogenase
MGLAPALRDPALRALKAVHDLLLSAGGKRYLSGWLFGTDDTGAQAEHNAVVALVARAKAALDENHVLNSCLYPH